MGILSRTLTFDSTVYRLTAIKKAAYRFGDRCYTEIQGVGSSSIEVILQTKSKEIDLDQVAGEFMNEVLDQELREVVSQETAAIRNLLLAQAFSATSLVDATGESADFREDPLKIAQPDRS